MTLIGSTKHQATTINAPCTTMNLLREVVVIAEVPAAKLSTALRDALVSCCAKPPLLDSCPLAPLRQISITQCHIRSGSATSSDEQDEGDP